MQTSESVGAIATALAAAQAVMSGAAKGKVNPAFGSRYADLEAVVDAIKKPLTDNGISYVQFPCTNDKDEVGVVTMLLHKSGEWIRSDPYYVPVKKADAQGFGSALTYTRRYSLMAACGIAPEDDDGQAAAKAKPEAKIPTHIPANVEGEELWAKADGSHRQWIEEQADQIIALFNAGANVADFWDGQHYTDEEKLMLTLKLPAHVRRKIKDQQRAKIDAAKRPRALAEQA